MPVVETVVEGGGHSAVLTQLRTLIGAEPFLCLREQGADGDAAASQGFEDAGAGGTQCRVLAVGQGDKRIEDRIIEDSPPGVRRRRG
jgi:hypothetical protein